MMIELPILSRQLNLLGCGFRLPPTHPDMAGVLALFALPDWAGHWPGVEKPHLTRLAAAFMPLDLPSVAHAWQRLFAGPGTRPAPPWGSVYLDPERVVRGCSTVALSHFLQRERLQLHTESPEPPDHLGLMLFQAAVLAAEGREAALLVLLEEHLLSWLPLFVHQLRQAEHPGFYPGLAELTLLTVQSAVATLKNRPEPV
ncbi:molecular chaperone TorD family protein [Nissabacter archeti]|uniref:Molecular chaperone TorD family protein n=1 Tax=Nissabacter archeti TaxID=1917880 RepID=A0ABS5JD06_9GAMM|nr:molecular chaperone TorD family protein [Nissabacter archeti]MBS0967844.1 molecular chaperone TorD family protein [Nissabacter archeti]